MPRPRKNPDAPTFDFKTNPEKELAKTTLSNYKNVLNRLTEYSVFEHERDASKPIIKTKEDLLTNTKYVLQLINDRVGKRLTKTTTLASIFYIIGRQDDEKHPYVQAFRSLYYTDTYKMKLQEEGKIIEDAKNV
jgi:hypothetical protein